MISINERSKRFNFEGGLYDIFQKALKLESEGKSIIHNIEQIDRGYENIDGRLKALGADIERIQL